MGLRKEGWKDGVLYLTQSEIAVVQQLLCINHKEVGEKTQKDINYNVVNKI